MVSATFAAFAALFAAFTAIELFPVLELQSRSGTSSSTRAASTFDDSAVQVLLPLAATVALFTAVAYIYLHHVAAEAVGARNKRLSELVPFVLCGAAGVLLFVLFVLPAGGVDVALVRTAVVGALPVTATVVFFLGTTLVIAHIRAGGEGGGGDNRRVPVPVDVLKRIALGAAAALLGQIAIAALYVK